MDLQPETATASRHSLPWITIYVFLPSLLADRLKLGDPVFSNIARRSTILAEE